MIFDVIDKKICNAFSNAAVQYDVLASLHREIGRELTRKLRNLDGGGWILDVGMGTGWFTNRMKHFFSESRVVGLDFSSQMIKGSLERDEIFDRIQGDANHLPLRSDSIKLITSNLAYQWVTDLSSAFGQCHNVLQHEGHIMMTMFGYNTFKEIFKSLENVKGSSSFNIQRLAKVEDVKEALYSAGFKDVIVDYERIKVRYPDMMAILKWIKDIGANTRIKNLFIGKDLLGRANDYYNETYCDRFGVYTTFEVIWLEGKK